MIAAERLERHISRVPESGCWVWTGASTKDGYGRVNVEGKNQYAHRVMYGLFKGYIHKGLVIDHLCRVRSCVNPEHLDAVSIQENIARGDQTNKGWRRNLSHCKKGHELTDDNTYKRFTTVGFGVTRICKTCHKNWRTSKGVSN